jgi:type IV pilus assembly protein PilB
LFEITEKRLGDSLIDAGKITPDQLKVALDEQKRNGLFLGETLRNLGYIDEETLAECLAAQADVEFVNLEKTAVNPAALQHVSESVARRNRLIPIDIQYDNLIVAQANPFDVLAIDELRQLTPLNVIVKCSSAPLIQQSIDRYYSGGNAMESAIQDSVRHVEEEGLGTPFDFGEDVKIADGDSADVPVVKLVDKIIYEGIKRRATDVHIEPDETDIRVRYRVDGILQHGSSIPKSIYHHIISRVKILSNLNISERRFPQEGRINFVIDNKKIDLRTSTFPTVFGEKVAIRIMEKENLIRGLDRLGMDQDNFAIFTDIIHRSRGIVLVCGPTGVGKTTTLYSALSNLNTAEKNIITLEDPVEFRIPGIEQSQVNNRIGYTFTVGMKSILRQDPDIIFIGEIRDPESMQLAIRASLTGVLIFSTLHTNDAVGAIPRLLDMGLEPYLLTSALLATVAQRLVRVICPHCKVEASGSREQLQKLGMNVVSREVKLYRGKGCERCGKTGFLGRTGIFEVLRMTQAVHEQVLQRADANSIRETARSGGMVTLMEDGLKKAALGITSVEEVMRVASY